MKNEHTPAPWYAYDNFSFVLANVPQDINHKIYKGFNEPVYDGKYLICESVPLEANASLIAAAPELLEALEMLLEQCIEKYADSDNEWPVAITNASAAIAKARGSV